MLLTIVDTINDYLALAKEPSDNQDTKFLRTVFCGRQGFLKKGVTYPFTPVATVWDNCGRDIVLNGIHDHKHRYSNGLVNHENSI